MLSPKGVKDPAVAVAASFQKGNLDCKIEVHIRLRLSAGPLFRLGLTSEPLAQFLVLLEELVRQIGFERLEKLFLAFQLFRPLVRLDRE